MNREDVIREMVAKYRKRIETLQELIRELLADDGPQSSSAGTGDIDEGEPTTTGALPIEVKEWQFMGKSQPEAAKALLAAAGRPLTTEQIIDGIKKGGIKVGGGKFSFYNILRRADDVARFRRNTWGLSEWPGAPKKKAPQPQKKKPARKKAPAGKKKKRQSSDARSSKETSEEKGL